jgi:uncharacterized protein
MAALSFLDLAFEVLKGIDKPLTYSEIWNTAKVKGVASQVKTVGKTPWQSLGSQLYVDVRENASSKFVKLGKRPARFFLKERMKELPSDILEEMEKEEKKQSEKPTAYHERELHPLLTYFAYYNLAFNRGKFILTKTILHEKSLKSGYNEWIHPDIVGFYFPLNDWLPDVMELNKLSDNNALRLYSFEMKKSLNKTNYRESFFQAVSNSSWAHEGYLVAVDILQDDDFLDELERLSASFGIGIIRLDPTDLGSSDVLFPAKHKEILDWETINKLCEQNTDFAKFLGDVKTDFNSKKIHPSEYDSIIKDIGNYISKKLGIEEAT